MSSFKIGRGESLTRDIGQAYDAAKRAYRDGPEQARAFNRLRSIAKADSDPATRKRDDELREIGVRAGSQAASDRELLPLIRRMLSGDDIDVWPGKDGSGPGKKKSDEEKKKGPDGNEEEEKEKKDNDKFPSEFDQLLLYYF